MAYIIDGKKISQEIKDELKAEVAALKEQGTEICLAVIQVGKDPASSVYVGNKKKAVYGIIHCNILHSRYSAKVFHTAILGGYSNARV